jgi:hypothetical protein
MDHDRFDAISRQLVAGAHRRLLLKWLTATALGGWAATSKGEALARQPKVTICHFPRGRPRPGVVARVPRRSLQAHVEHGDFPITGKGSRTAAACRATCKNGTPACDASCCRGGETCEQRNAFRPARTCCPPQRIYVECPSFLVCPDDPLACCALPGEYLPFCCDPSLQCGATCCYEGEQCRDPATSQCTCPPAQQCGDNCCWPGLACLDPVTGECEIEVGFARLRRP